MNSIGETDFDENCVRMVIEERKKEKEKQKQPKQVPPKNTLAPPYVKPKPKKKPKKVLSYASNDSVLGKLHAGNHLNSE